MLLTVYIHVVPGWDRPFVTLNPPTNPQDFEAKGGKLFLIEAELPGFEKIDGVVRTRATPVDQPGIRLPSPMEPVESAG